MMRVLKYIWYNTVMVLTSWLPDITPILKFRGFLAQFAFKRCGRNLQIAKNVYIAFPNKLEIGRDVYLAYGVWIQAAGGISLEDEVLLGPYVILVSGNHTIRDGSYRFGSGSRAPICLKKGCWIGAHSTVTKGVTVGLGSLLAANAVATADIPDGCIAGGIPAKVIKQNTSSENGN